MPAVAGREKILITDASKVGLSAFLVHQEDAGRRTVLYMRRKLQARKKMRYGTTETGAIVVAFALRNLRPWLDSEKSTLGTDCIALKWLGSMKDPKPRFGRWMVDTMTYDFEIE